VVENEHEELATCGKPADIEAKLMMVDGHLEARLVQQQRSQQGDDEVGYGRDKPGPPAIVSTIELMQAGFCEVIDTEAMFRKAFAEMQAKKLLPPR
jgi:hypothetical protein